MGLGMDNIKYPRVKNKDLKSCLVGQNPNLFNYISVPGIKGVQNIQPVNRILGLLILNYSSDRSDKIYLIIKVSYIHFKT